MRLEERLPGYRALSLRGRFDTVFLEDIPDGGVGDLMAEIGGCPLNAIIAPCWILSCHAQDEAGNIRGNRRSSRSHLSPVAVVPLFGNELSVPAQNRVGSDDRGELHQSSSAESFPLTANARR